MASSKIVQSWRAIKAFDDLVFQGACVNKRPQVRFAECLRGDLQCVCPALFFRFLFCADLFILNYMMHRAVCTRVSASPSTAFLSLHLFVSCLLFMFDVYGDRMCDCIVSNTLGTLAISHMSASTFPPVFAPHSCAPWAVL
eukprot:m.100758 g.100758  ORF g.100758 m.100758 type:complete len:141 (-) comp13183_c0_seq1:1-423(-)